MRGIQCTRIHRYRSVSTDICTQGAKTGRDQFQEFSLSCVAISAFTLSAFALSEFTLSEFT